MKDLVRNDDDVTCEDGKSASFERMNQFKFPQPMVPVINLLTAKQLRVHLPILIHVANNNPAISQIALKPT